jgi:hypothetical protein
VGQHMGQDIAITKMHMPVVGAGKGQGVLKHGAIV